MKFVTLLATWGLSLWVTGALLHWNIGALGIIGWFELVVLACVVYGNEWGTRQCGDCGKRYDRKRDDCPYCYPMRINRWH
jgi:hypothetical protein